MRNSGRLLIFLIQPEDPGANRLLPELSWKSKMLFRILRRLYLALDTTRRVTANVLFAFVMLLVIGLIWYGFRTPSIPSSSILEIDINGKVVMQPSALVGGRNWVAKMTGTRVEETTVSDVTDALRVARSDRRIKAVLLRLDHMTGAGPASIYEIGRAIKDYEASGHKVYAWSDSYTQAQWGIASHANEIYLHPMGEVKVRGLEATSFYLGSVLNKLGVTVNVAKAGAYKSAPEMFTNSAPSEDALTAQRFWLNDEWAQLSSAMETGRGLSQGYLKTWMDNYLDNLRRAGGDAARMAKETGLVNGIANWNDLRSRLAGHDCFSGACAGEFTSLGEYLGVAPLPHSSGDGAVGVVTLEGEITEESVGNGNASANALIAMIRDAEMDPSVKAVVLRINSPGGSALASEKIREALISLRKSGKPLVAYFGDMAASGGYWVSTAAQRVVSNPLSITGSIGVYGMMPTFDKSLAKLGVGVNSESTGTTGISSSPLVPFTSNAKAAAELQVSDTYAKFLYRVSQARNMTVEAVNNVAQGRVWTGRQAKERGLVDQLGTFDDAAEQAAKLAGIDKSYALKFFEPPATAGVADALLAQIASEAGLPVWIRTLAASAISAADPTSGEQKTSDFIQARTLWQVR